MNKIRTIIGAIALFLLAIFVVTPANAATVQPSDEASKVSTTTYCGWPDIAEHPDIYKPVRATDGKIYAKNRWTCSPYGLTGGIFTSQLEKKGPYGNYQNYGASTQTKCGDLGSGVCPRSGWVVDWAYCNESGWYRTEANIYGHCCGSTQTWNSVTRYSTGVYVYCG